MPLFTRTPSSSVERYLSHFLGDSLRLRKESPRSETNTGKRKLAFFCPYLFRTLGEAKASPKKMTQSSAVLPKKRFLRSFFLKKATLGAAAPPRPLNLSHSLTSDLNFVLHVTNSLCHRCLITRNLKADIAIVAYTSETLDARADVDNAVADTAIIQIFSGAA